LQLVTDYNIIKILIVLNIFFLYFYLSCDKHLSYYFDNKNVPLLHGQSTVLTHDFYVIRIPLTMVSALRHTFVRQKLSQRYKSQSVVEKIIKLAISDKKISWETENDGHLLFINNIVVPNPENSLHS